MTARAPTATVTVVARYFAQDASYPGLNLAKYFFKRYYRGLGISPKTRVMAPRLVSSETQKFLPFQVPSSNPTQANAQDRLPSLSSRQGR
jgi:hypothetical protein